MPINYAPRPKPPAYPAYAGKYSGNKPRTKNTTPWGSPPPFIRTTDTPASLNPSQCGAPHAAKHDPNKYTGTACLGIAAMHKSNLVPIFNADAAVDAATMRRN
jgi:hypothetical protein